MPTLFSTEETILTPGMKIALWVSAGLHFGVFALAYFGMPHVKKELVLPPQAVAIDIVDVSELTTTDKKSNLAPVKPKEEKQPPKAEEKPVAPPRVEVKEPPKVKPIEKPPEPKKDTVPPKPKTPPPPSEKLAEAKPPPPKEEKPKEEEKEEAVQQEDPLLSLMRNLQESEEGAETENPDEGTPEESPDAPIAQYVTANELNALTNQLIQCWQIPIGAKNVHDMVVKVRIWANPDRSVRRVEIEDQWRLVNDPAFRALAESAKRAVFDPFCNPLALPEDKFEVWKDQYIVVPFDPSRVT